MFIIFRLIVWLIFCCLGGKIVFEDYINFDGLGFLVLFLGV